MQKKPLVIILGGGFAGVRVALDLARRKSAKIILIDKSPYHAMHGQFYELASFFHKERHGETTGEIKRDFHNSLNSASIAYDDIFHRHPSVEVMRAQVVKVKPRESMVLFADGRGLYYDWLIYALGSETNYFNIPHLEQNAFGLKTPEDALNIRDRIDELFYHAPKHKKITVVISGGGFTGIELAGELVGYMKKLAVLHHHPVGNWACIVMEASSSILSTSSVWAQQKAKKRLARLGVTVILDHSIVDVLPNLLYAGKERQPLAFDILIWTAGVQGSSMSALIEGVEPSEKRCIPVDETLRMKDAPNIFVAGDSAATLDQKTKQPIPMTAQKALHEASYISRALLALIENPKTKLAKYRPKLSSYIIPLGGKYAILETPHIRASGCLVWALKYAVTFKYLISIVPFRKAFSVLMREIQLYTKND
jgi:NADH dehydrogenase